MFYEPKNGHNLPHNPFSAIVTPRPIGWISTRSAAGQDNLAPYSFFNAVAYTPPQVMFSSTAFKEDRHLGKDSVANIDETDVFCVNIVSMELVDAMNLSSGSYPMDTDEFDLANLTKAQCEMIDCPRVADAPAALECRKTKILHLEGDNNIMVLGEVVGIHIADDHIVDGRLDITRFQPVGRLGYRDYAAINSVFALARPSDKT